MKERTERSENRRARPRLLLIMLGAAVGGGIIGFFTGISANIGLGDRLTVWMDVLMTAIAPWAIPATTAVTMGAALLLYAAARRQYLGWDGEDEDPMDQAEEKLSWVLLLTGLQMALSMFFFAAAVQYLSSGAILAVVAEFLVSCGLVIFAQQKAVDLTKRMNPEKHGSVYDTKFHQKWMDSCDEAERQQIGQASYHAFRIAGSACVWIWVVLIVLDFTFDIGILPAFVAMLLWGILQMSYALECIRLAKRSRRGS